MDEGAREHFVALPRRLEPSLGFYLVILVLAVFAPAVASFGFLAIAVQAVTRL